MQTLKQQVQSGVRAFLDTVRTAGCPGVSVDAAYLAVKEKTGMYSFSHFQSLGKCLVLAGTVRADAGRFYFTSAGAELLAQLECVQEETAVATGV